MGLKVVPSPNVGGVKAALEDLKVCLVKGVVKVCTCGCCVSSLDVFLIHALMYVHTYVVSGGWCICLCMYIRMCVHTYVHVCCMHT